MDSTQAARSRWLLAFILLAGLLIRVYHLGHESLWLDESYSLDSARLSFAEGFKSAAEDVHPPLYISLLYVWIRVFGESETVLRSLAVLFGVLGILFIYKLGRLLFSESAGLCAAAIMAVNVYHVAYSQETRGYSLMVFLALVSVYFFAKILLGGERPSRKDTAMYAASTFLLLYTHTFAAFTVFAENLFFFAALARGKDFAKRNWKFWLKIQTVLFLSYLPWVVLVKYQADYLYKNFWIEPPSFKFLAHTMRRYAGSFKLLAVEGLLIGIFLLNAWRTRDSRRLFAVSILGIWFAAVLFIPVFISLFWTPIFNPRYSIAASVPIYILAAAGLRDIRRIRVRWAAAAFILILSAVRLVPYFTEPQKEQWREAAAFVDEHSRPGELVIFHREKGIFDYYSKKQGLVKAQFPKPVHRSKLLFIEESVRVTPERIKELPAILGGHQRVWLVLTHVKDPDGLFVREMRSRYRQVYDQKYLGVEVLLFERT